MSSNKLVVYHSPCADGFTAAWAVWLKFPDAEFVKGIYGQPPPDCTGRDVIMVDFSYKRGVMINIINTANSVVVLDHHKTAEAELLNIADHVTMGKAPQIHFNMAKSGAMLAWEYFHGPTEAPTLVKYVEDRDLWRFALSWSNDVNAYILSFPYDFEQWSAIATGLAQSSIDGPIGIMQAAEQGKAINRKISRDIRESLEVTKNRVFIAGELIWCANMPYQWASQAAHIMAEGEPFAATYYRRNDGKYVYSLRSHEQGTDVSVVAKLYGGGGHAHAAGFETCAELR